MPYTVELKTDRMTATRDHLQNGTLEIQDSGGLVLATFAVTAAGGTVSGDTWTVSFTSSTVEATGSGTASQAVMKESGGAVRVTGLTVGDMQSTSHIRLDNTNIASGQNVSLGTATVTHG